VAGLVADGSPATLDELARLIGTDPDIALMVTAVTEALQRLGVETLTQIEDHNMPAAATATARVEAWDHDRFLEACFDRGIGNARQLEEYANARQAEGDKPMIRRSAQRYLDGDADPFCGSPGRYPAAARLARVLDVDLRWLLGLTDVRGVYCA